MSPCWKLAKAMSAVESANALLLATRSACNMGEPGETRWVKGAPYPCKDGPVPDPGHECARGRGVQNRFGVGRGLHQPPDRLSPLGRCEIGSAVPDVEDRLGRNATGPDLGGKSGLAWEQLYEPHCLGGWARGWGSRCGFPPFLGESFFEACDFGYNRSKT